MFLNINYCFILACVLAIRLFAVAAAENSTEEEQVEENEALHWRLPNASYPLSYDIHITTNLHRGDYDYNGNCSIMVQVQQDNAALYLHARDLNITAVRVTEWCENTTDVVCNQFDGVVAFENVTDVLIISNRRNVADAPTFKRNLRYFINIIYTGVITTNVDSFHQITETEADNSTVIGAMTMFEPTHARSFLPCYDEPGLKANFTLSVTHARNYTVISNMPQLAESIDSAECAWLTTTKFMPTPVMSTYLLAFVIFLQDAYVNYATTKENHTIPQRLFIPNSLQNKIPVTETASVPAALEIADSATKALIDYFEYPFALPKLDHITVTKMYGAGMENWGLITYITDTLSNQNGMQGLLKRLFQTSTICHEITHQWFGNLVTAKWWDQIWLSEGITSYISSKIINEVNSEFDAIKQIECDISYVYSKEGAIVNYAEKPSDILKLFDHSIYGKAPCMLQMFNYALGETIFRKGLNLYIQRHAYTAVTEQQLFDAFQAAAIEYYSKQLNRTWKYQLDNIFETWTHSKSYPIVTITMDDADSNILKIKQKSFNKTLESNLWWIPLKFSTSTVQQQHVIFMPPIAEWSIDVSTLGINLTENDWFIVSMENKAIYMIFYDNDNMRHLAAALNSDHKQINNYERAALLNQQSENLQLYNDEQVLTLFELLKYLEHENDIYVWNIAAITLCNIAKHLKQLRSFETVIKYIERLTKPIFLKYPLEKSKDSTLTLDEGNLIYLFYHNLGCFLEMSSCIEKRTSSYLREFSSHRFLEDEDIACAVGKTLNDTMFDKLINEHFHVKTTRPEKENFMYLLKCTKNNELYEQIIQKQLKMEMCKEKYAGLNILLTNMEFKKSRTTLQILNEHIEELIIHDGEVCAESELFLQTILSYCLKAEAYELSNIKSLCLQHSLSSNITDVFNSPDFYNALDEKLFVWLSNELDNEINKE